jgi:hypothetical protein
MTEYVNVQRATFVANLTFEAYKPICAASRQRQCHSDPKASYKRAVEWALQHASSKDGVTFTYRFAEGKSFGRMTSNSLQGIPRDIRGFVCMDPDSGQSTMTDLDMNNCHPVILLWLCHEKGIACGALVEYVRNRAHHMDEMMSTTGKSRDEVKRMFLAAVNSESEMRGYATLFFRQFDSECKAIQQAFMNLSEYRWLLPHAERSANEKLEEKKKQLRRDRKTVNGLTANVAGSFINLLLCTWENRFLGVACKTLTAMGLEVCTNMFDGAMIRGDHYQDANICPALEKALFDAFRIQMAWSMKRHSTSIVQQQSGDLKLPYSRHAAPFLDKVCRVGSQYLVQNEDGSHEMETGRQLEDRFKAETFKCILADPDGKPIEPWCNTGSFADTLCRDPAMRTYEKMDTYPDASECPAYVYNLWKPMPCQEWDPTLANPTSEHVAAFRKHILILSDHDPDVAAFIELFIAHMIHHPSHKPQAWIVLLSEEGAGKGTLIRLIVRLVGALPKVREISNVKRSLAGPFNQVMLDAFFVVLDEAKDLFDISEELKHMITEPTVTVNQKGIKEVEVRSYARFMLTSQPRVVPTKKGDRRGVIVRSSDELIGNKAYFDGIKARMDDAQAIADFHAYLMTLKPPRVFTAHDLPQTAVQREMQAANADVFDSWIEDLVDKWRTLDGIQTSDNGGVLRPPCSHSADYLVDYQGERDPKNLHPDYSLLDLFRNFKCYAERANATKLMDTLTFPRFVSKFGMSRWRKLFTPTKHKKGGVQLQCRRFDIEGLARDLKLDEPDAEATQVPHVETRPVAEATQATAEVPHVETRPDARKRALQETSARCADCAAWGTWMKCPPCAHRDFRARTCR